MYIRDRIELLRTESICLCLCNLPLATILADVYSETRNKYCRGNGSSFSGLDAAKIRCSEDDNCAGLYDSCGKGNSFKLCNWSSGKWASGCGSILYQKRGK